MRICCSSGVGWRKEATFFCFMSGSIKNCGRLVPQNHSMPSLLAAFRYRKTRPTASQFFEKLRDRVKAPNSKLQAPKKHEPPSSKTDLHAACPRICFVGLGA